jgi:nucleoside-diphosphate-sugar epimerase
VRVFITGISGFVGSAVADALEQHGHEATGSATRVASSSATGARTLVSLRLGEPFDAAIFDGVDAVVHAAHDLTPNSRTRNVAGTIALAEAAAGRGVANQLYVSSYSAHAGAVTEYGMTKLETEAWFLARGYSVVRPGLVIGKGGLYARMSAMVRALPVVPVVFPNAAVPIVDSGDLALAIVRLLEHPRNGVVHLYLEERTTMGGLMHEIRRAARARSARSALLLPVPQRVALAAARMLEAIASGRQFGSESMRALEANQGAPHHSDLASLVSAPKSLREMVHAAG